MFLLDTNIVSEFSKRKPDERVVKWAFRVIDPFVSAMTVDELYFGLSAKPNSAIQRWLENYLANDCRVLEVTVAIARHAGVLRGQLARRGKVRKQADMIIATTASAHGLTLATRNARDFDGCGIPVFDPFTD